MNIDNFLQNKSCVVTGAAGFIGSHLCESLLKLGAKVIGVDNFSTGSNDNLESMLQTAGEFAKNFTFIKADVNQPPATYLTIDSAIDFVFHFASAASPDKYQAFPRETYLVNSWATHQLLDFLLAHQPQARFIFASTSEVYGDPLQHPQPESYWGNVNPNGIRSCYDEAKRLGETICGVYEREFAMDVRIVRIFNTYGPRMDINDGRVIPNFIKFSLAGEPVPVYGEGQQTRSYCYVTDLVAGILSLAGLPNLKGETINLGNPQELTVFETAQLVKQLIIGKFDPNQDMIFKPLPKDDPTRRKPDISKAKKLLNWEPQVKFEQGLNLTIEYFKTHLNK